MKIIKILPGKNEIKLSTSSGLDDVFFIGTKGGDVDLKLNVDNSDVNVNIYGVIIGSGDQNYSINTLSNHLQPGSRSRVHIKTIALDEANIVFKGLINIEKKAQFSDAYLKNDNLVLSKDAHVESSPQLEIKADDVKASHGVTISNLSDTELHYIMSRGINYNNARRLMIFGFVNSLLEKINDRKTKSDLIKLINNLA